MNTKSSNANGLYVALAIVLIALSLGILAYQAGTTFPTVEASSPPTAFDLGEYVFPRIGTQLAPEIGDCMGGYVGHLYPVPESGAAGYCYVAPAEAIVVVEPKREKDVSPVEPIIEVVVVIPPASTEEEDPTPEPAPEKKHCDKGEGNGGEECDPGRNPEKGNDDENNTSPSQDHKHKGRNK